MTNAHSIMRTRAFKLVVGLCVVSALAFLLGQGVAAYRAGLAHESTASAQSTIIRVAGAQGSVSRPAGGAPTQASVGQAAASAITLAMSSQPGDQGHGHKKHHDHSHQSDKNAAGDGSHGGISHQSKHDQGNGHGNDQGQGNSQPQGD